MISAIRAEGVTKEFRSGFLLRRVGAVRGLSFNVEEGAIFGFVGPNGAGKTTTIKMLVGLISPTTGRVLLFGRPPADPESRQSVGFLPEGPYFYDHLTGREFLSFTGRLFDLSGRELEQRVSHLLDRVGVASAADRRLRTYSKGMLQRIGIAQALVNDPRLLILDEPMSGLDPVGRREIRDLLLELKAEGKTIFFSTHILPDVEKICDRVGIIVEGRLKSEGRLEDLLKPKIRAYEVVLRGISPSELQDWGLSSRTVLRGEELFVDLEEEANLSALLRKVLESGGRVVAVTPKKETLEDLLLGHL